MRIGIVGFLLFLATGCATVAPPPNSYAVEIAKGNQNNILLCWTMRDFQTVENKQRDSYLYSDEAMPVPSLVLQVAKENESMTVDVNGEPMNAEFIRRGLTMFWAFDEDMDTYIRVDPDLTAGYWDFAGAAEGEERAPTAMFGCQKYGE